MFHSRKLYPSPLDGFFKTHFNSFRSEVGTHTVIEFQVDAATVANLSFRKRCCVCSALRPLSPGPHPVLPAPFS
ncbi:Hypothetical predicted protein [Scomber scombrus]|uniref:Uncharacterized protein n=1 Tax=Scomber scombrus TaxID=13677 RepID=A0AAV1NXC9_SCOSC